MKIFRDVPLQKKPVGRPKGTTGIPRKKSNSKATPQKKYIKIKRFVTEYLVDLNGQKAYQRCGWDKDNDQAASVNAGKLLNRIDVIQLIAEAEAERAKRVEITQEMVLKELSLLAFANLKDVATWDGQSFILKPFDQLTRDQAAIISNISLKRTPIGDFDVKFGTPSAADKRTALVDLGKHLGMFWEGTQPVDPLEIAKKVKQAAKEMQERTMPE